MKKGEVNNGGFQSLGVQTGQVVAGLLLFLMSMCWCKSNLHLKDGVFISWPRKPPRSFPALLWFHVMSLPGPKSHSQRRPDGLESCIMCAILACPMREAELEESRWPFLLVVTADV